MSLVTRVRPARAPEPVTRPDPTLVRSALPALMVAQGAALLIVTGRAGSPLWRAMWVLASVGVTIVAVAVASGAGPLGRGGIALLLGIVGTVAGAGIGGVYLSKVGMSMTTVASLITLVTGLWMLVLGATSLTRALPGWWRLLAVPAALLILVFVLYPLSMAVNVTNRPATPLGAATPADRGLP
jgi:hypothetical protein